MRLVHSQFPRDVAERRGANINEGSRRSFDFWIAWDDRACFTENEAGSRPSAQHLDGEANSLRNFKSVERGAWLNGRLTSRSPLKSRDGPVDTGFNCNLRVSRKTVSVEVQRRIERQWVRETIDRNGNGSSIDPLSSRVVKVSDGHSSASVGVHPDVEVAVRVEAADGYAKIWGVRRDSKAVRRRSEDRGALGLNGDWFGIE